MQELIQEFGRYIAGAISVDEFRSATRAYLAAHPEQREAAAEWFRAGVQSGRLSADIGELTAELFAAGAAPRSRRSSDAAAENRDVNALQVGEVLLNRYRLVAELGRGGTGQVFKAVDRYLEGDGRRNPFIALKALNATYVADAGARTALLDEAMRAKTLSHDNIVRVDNFDWDGPRIFITMEYLRGKGLDVLMGSDYAHGLPLRSAWPIIEKIANALQYAHEKGVVHSDVKPSNIFITQKEEVKVLDFGISRLMAKSALVQTETQLEPEEATQGLTPAYASLEQWQSKEPDPRDDIYSFALVVYELLTGHHPFAGAPSFRAFEVRLEPTRIETLSRTQWEALHKALSLPRETRTKTVKEFQRALAPVTALRKYAVWIATGSVAAIALAIAIGSHQYQNHVEQQMLCAGALAAAVRPPLTVAQRAEIKDSLFLARDYLREAKIELKPEDLAYVLSEGANNVNQILESVLALDPTNAAALAMKSQIAELYLVKARQVDEKRQALKLVRFGLKVSCNNLDLFHLQRDICDQQAALCAAN
jgi:serine/threonine protein kinase